MQHLERDPARSPSLVPERFPGRDPPSHNSSPVNSALQMWHCANTELKIIKRHKRVSEILCRVYTYLCPWIIFPDNCISCMACSRHFTSSVGQRTRVAKAEAKEPAAAFCRSLHERNCRGYLGTDLQCSGATAPAISFLNLYSKYHQEKLMDSLGGKEPQGKRAVTWTREMKNLAHPIFTYNSNT